MAKKAYKKPSGLSFADLMRRKSWKPLPDIVVLAGDASFLKKKIQDRFAEELFGDEPTPSIDRYDATTEGDDLLARVLDDLRTLSFLSPIRLVVVRSADSFLGDCRDDLEPLVAEGFAGGHLILHVDRAPRENSRFAKAVLEKGWLVRCPRPFDKPPPWKSQSPPWENDLTQWIVAWARYKGLEIDPPTAYQLQSRVGTDLGVIDEFLEKILAFRGEKSGRIDSRAIEELTGDSRDDSIFDLVESFIRADRPRALVMADKLFEHGYHPTRGNPVYDASAITSLFIGAVIARLKPLRRAHALKQQGNGAESWLELGLTTRPFIDRFRTDLKCMPLDRIEKTFASLLDLDRAFKTGADPRLGLTIVLSRN